MKSIFRYESFRLFIRDLFEHEKKSARAVTLAQYARRFGLSAPALNLILSGKRNLTVDNLNEVARVLRLSRTEREYFEALVLREQAATADAKSYYGSRLKSLKKVLGAERRHVADRALLSNWVIPALLIYLIDFERIQSFDQINYERLAKKFGLEKNEIERLVLLFQKQGLLEIDREHGVHIVFDRVTTEIPQKEFVRATQVEMLKRLDKEFADPKSLFRATVFSLDEAKIPDFRRDQLELLERYISAVQPEKDKCVIMQGVVGFYPVIDG